MRRTATAAVLLTAVPGLLLGGCGERPGSAGDPTALTPRAVAAVMLDHLPGDTTRREATYVDEHSPEGLVGADFRYRGGEGEDGNLVRVTVSREEARGCDPEEQCARLDGGVLLRWEDEAPEEDPGVVALQRAGADGTVTVLLSGPVITADPRTLDLEPSVDALAAVARDPRLRLRTDAAVVTAGEAVDDWAGGEVAEGSLDRVANDDRSVVMGWLTAYGDRVTYVGRSPVAQVLGARAVGGRGRVGAAFEPVGPGLVDALAAPEPPEWMASGGCLPRYRCAEIDGLTFAWRPAAGKDPGDGYVLFTREGGETVGFHTVGRRLPADAREAAGAAGLFMWGPDLEHPENSGLPLGYWTTRERLEQYGE